MTDPRIAIVRAWLGEDNPWEHVDRLLDRCDAAISPSGDLVERVAKAIQSTRAQQFGAEEPWASIPESEQDEFRELARAAIREMPALMSFADREVVELADVYATLYRDDAATTGDCETAAQALVEAVERKRAASREGKK